MSVLIPSLRAAILAYVPAAPESGYYGDWIAQTYGFESDIYPSWWAS
jgi:hypothetical protein